MEKTSEKLISLQSAIIMLHSTEEPAETALGAVMGVIVTMYYAEEATALDRAVTHELFEVFSEKFGKEEDPDKFYVYMLDQMTRLILAAREYEKENENEDK